MVRSFATRPRRDNILIYRQKPRVKRDCPLVCRVAWGRKGTPNVTQPPANSERRCIQKVVMLGSVSEISTDKGTDGAFGTVQSTGESVTQVRNTRKNSEPRCIQKIVVLRSVSGNSTHKAPDTFPVQGRPLVRAFTIDAHRGMWSSVLWDRLMEA